MLGLGAFAALKFAHVGELWQRYVAAKRYPGEAELGAAPVCPAADPWAEADGETGGDHSAPAGGQVVAPLLTFGGLSGQVKQAEALKQQAVFQYRQAILTAFQEVEDALIKTTKGREQLEAQGRQVRALEEYSRLSRLQFEAGTSNYLQVLDADRSLFSGRLAFSTPAGSSINSPSVRWRK